MMKFSEIVNRIPSKFGITISRDFEVKGLAYDSRKVKPGYIFFAIKGLKDDGSKYIKDAKSSGAELIVASKEMNVESEVLKTAEIRKVMAMMSGIFYGNPSEKIKLIGITGTNGKTTTTYLIRAMLNDAGYKVGLIGTIGYETGNINRNSVLTTPDSVELNMMLGEMVNSKMEFCVMEVSSIALSMDRVYGLNFDTAIFTNLTSEHLDFHHDMKNYFQAKKILFDGLTEKNYAVSNKDDEYGESILNNTKAKKIYYSTKKESDLKAFNENLRLSGLEFDVKINGNIYNIKSKLTGRFNIYNILASMSAVLNYDTEIEKVRETLLNFEEVRGRYNRIELPNGAVAVVDYSHTSDSLRNAIQSAREIIIEEKSNAKVVTIFGCGGNRDRTKRPVMGNYATTLSDYTIITSDNPRFEDPDEIINEILKGITTKNNYEVIENREEAIRRGIEISSKNDIVLICGKGHETYQETMGVKEHFDDKEIVQKYISSAK